MPLKTRHAWQEQRDLLFYWNKKGLVQEGKIDDESNNSISKSLSEHRKVLG